MVPSEKRDVCLLMLFDSLSIDKHSFSLLHTEICIGNKIINSFYEWITTYIEPLSEEEVEMSNKLIDLQVEHIHNK